MQLAGLLYDILWGCTDVDTWADWADSEAFFNNMQPVPFPFRHLILDCLFPQKKKKQLIQNSKSWLPTGTKKYQLFLGEPKWACEILQVVFSLCNSLFWWHILNYSGSAQKWWKHGLIESTKVPRNQNETSSNTRANLMEKHPQSINPIPVFN